MSVIVLIEPKWNLKNTSFSTGLLCFCINRTKVEFKVNITISIRVRCIVLIEPKWNLKSFVITFITFLFSY